MSQGTIRISLYGNAILGFFAGFSSEWEIDEYDGMESISEKHRSWG